MQFIQGQGVDLVIAELKRLRRPMASCRRGAGRHRVIAIPIDPETNLAALAPPETISRHGGQRQDRPVSQITYGLLARPLDAARIRIAADRRCARASY